MSSEFLEDIDDDEHGTTVLLSMRASGHAFLHISTDVDDSDYESRYYHLPPNEQGWRNAEKIAAALTEWVSHTKRIFPPEESTIQDTV